MNLASVSGVQHDFPMTLSPQQWAQLALRAFARATNLLVSGQAFTIVSDYRMNDCSHVAQLHQLLRSFGAHVRIINPEEHQAVGEVPVQATFIIGASGTSTQEYAASCSGLRVLAPLQGEPLVIHPEGTVLLDPYDPTVHLNADSLAIYGAHRIAWARSYMPVTRAAVSALASEGLLAGKRVGLALVLEPKTAVLALELAAAGAEVYVFGHADETREDVVAVLRSEGLKVFAESSATPEREEELAREFLSQGLHYLLDDGSHLIRMAHDEQRAPGALASLVGAAEETTSGLRPLRTWEQTPGKLQIPVMASNDARSKTLFDNGYGTGQSCLFTIIDLVDANRQGFPMSDQHVVVIGYGDVGRGFARFSAAMGAAVSVVELDPVRAMLARMDGHGVGALDALAPQATMLVSATGVRHTITVEALMALPDGAIVAVAGGVEQEIATDDACASGAQWGVAPSRQIDPLIMPNGRRLLIADKGNCINVTAGEGNPIEIMDLSFGVQTASLAQLLRHGKDMPTGVHPLPSAADDHVCATALRVWQPLPSAISTEQEPTRD